MSRASDRTTLVLALAAVYFIWGSTYLALRFGLEGFPPFLLNGSASWSLDSPCTASCDGEGWPRRRDGSGGTRDEWQH